MIVGAVLLAWSNSWQGPFVFDDAPSIPGNPTIRSLAEAWQPPTDAGITVAGRPLLNFSFALNYALSGTEVWSYHAFNIGLHALTALLLYSVIGRTLAQSGIAPTLALGVTLVWALHPLQTAAVTYLVQRAESLAAFWLVLALYAFIRSTEPRAAVGWRWRAIAATFAGVATKETAAVGPLLLLLYDRTFIAGSFGEAWRLRRGFYAGLTSAWLLLAALLLLSGSRGGTAGLTPAISPAAYAWQQIDAITHYLRLIVWPHPQVFDYGTPLASWSAALAAKAVLLGTLLVGLAFALVRFPRAGFVGAAFFLLLAPSSSVIPVATQTMAEHRLYLPLAAAVVVVALIAYRFMPRATLAGLVAWAALLGGGTFVRNRAYADEVTLWRDTVAARPQNARAWHNLGFALAGRGQTDAAIAHYREAVARDPAYAQAMNNLGNALLLREHAAEAEAWLRRATELAPQEAEPWNSLGHLLLATGRGAEAVAPLARAVALAPNFALARSNYAQALAATDRLPEAVRELETAVRLAPADPVFRNNLAILLAATGRPELAAEHYETALRLAPEDARTHFNYGNLRLHQRQLERAAEHFAAAVRAEPGYVEARVNLAVALQQLGRRDEAIHHYQEALRLRPGDPFASENLRRLLEPTVP